MHASMHICMHTFIHTYACMHLFMTSNCPKCSICFNCLKLIHACIHASMHTCIHTCMHLHVHTFIHAMMLINSGIKTYKGLVRTELSNVQNACMHLLMTSNCPKCSICLICFFLNQIYPCMHGFMHPCIHAFIHTSMHTCVYS